MEATLRTGGGEAEVVARVTEFDSSSMASCAQAAEALRDATLAHVKALADMEMPQKRNKVGGSGEAEEEEEEKEEEEEEGNGGEEGGQARGVRFKVAKVTGVSLVDLYNETKQDNNAPAS